MTTAKAARIVSTYTGVDEMVPYRGRLALRIARIALAIVCFAWYATRPEDRSASVFAMLGAYLVYAVGVMFEAHFDSIIAGRIALIVDASFFAFWTWLAASRFAGWPAGGWTGWPASGWIGALLCGYLLASAIMLHDIVRTVAVAVFTLFLELLFAPSGQMPIVWVALACGAVSIALAFEKAYLDRRLSHTLRHNVIIRSQAQGAREAERERIAADFHDGPLQSFISFQMRLEIIKKLMSRDLDAAAGELKQLQELCKVQVGELRSFVRSMRPADDGISLPASLSRMVDQFQRDTGINSTFASGELHDPAGTEVSLELLQIVRETLNNIQKHSGATRMALSVGMFDHKVEIKAEDNGGGFPFAGAFTLDELELLRLGPASIKRRVRMLNGELQLDSRPGQGASLQIRIPV